VLKQKIWVDGTSYELQEIYGLEQAGKRPAGGSTGAAGGSSAAEEAEERLCVICLVNPRDTTVLPCRHMCLCSDCASELRKQSSKCPICRNNIESLLHIRINKDLSSLSKEKLKARDDIGGGSGGGGVNESSKVDGEAANGSVESTAAATTRAAAAEGGAQS
jgi:Zinc finger, C3HC4 type (RING finger)